MTATTAKVYIVGYSVALDDKHIEKINKVLADVPVYSRYDDKGKVQGIGLRLVPTLTISVEVISPSEEHTVG